MRKYVKQKCKVIREAAVMEVAHVGVRTRARALSMAAAAKRRKVSGVESKLSATSLIQLRSGRRAVVQGNSASPAASGHSDRATASCCSSNASSDVANESVKIVDLETASSEIETSTSNLSNRGRRETTPSSEIQEESGELESTARPTEANAHRRSLAGAMPSEIELEEFFVAAEKKLQKKFTEKYNYDIAKDVPLEGRYEWIQLNP